MFIFVDKLLLQILLKIKITHKEWTSPPWSWPWLLRDPVWLFLKEKGQLETHLNIMPLHACVVDPWTIIPVKSNIISGLCFCSELLWNFLIQKLFAKTLTTWKEKLLWKSDIWKFWDTKLSRCEILYFAIYYHSITINK